MKCTNCGSTHDVIDFIAGKEKLVLCSGCRAKIASGQLGKVGRPSLGITKKVSLTLDQDTWDWLDKKAEGNRSQFLRETVWNALGSESEWSNYACLGYAILGAKKLGYGDEQISKLVKAIYSEFDFKTVAEAEKVYTGSDY